MNEYIGNRSIKKEKNKNSDIKNNDPGNPKNIIQFIRDNRKSFGHRKLIPDISFTNLVLNLLAIESTIKKEFVEIIAWLISIANPANQSIDCPLIIHINNQCISATVAKAISFLISI